MQYDSAPEIAGLETTIFLSCAWVFDGRYRKLFSATAVMFNNFTAPVSILQKNGSCSCSKYIFRGSAQNYFVTVFPQPDTYF